MALQRLAGLIDVHVHLREPGATQKEDFTTGTKSAIAGGFTFVLDMPNNPQPTISVERLEEKVSLAKSKAVCDVGFNYGTNGHNTETFLPAANHPSVFGLKLYCNHTTGEMLVEDIVLLEAVFKAWNSDKPILAHAEGVQLAAVLSLARFYGRRLHVCHIARKAEVELVRQAKQKGDAVTAGVTPHHLFLTEDDGKKLGSFGIVKPYLATKEDQDALWEGILDGTIDLVESDHAPHTREEKQKDPPPFGMTGLETTLGLLGKAIHEGKLLVADIQRLVYDNPKKIFNIPNQPDTYIEVNFDEPWTVDASKLQTKAKSSPFDGWQLYGKVQTVVFKGKEVVGGGILVT